MTNLAIAFLIIFSISGAIYSFLVKKPIVALGLLVIATAFILNIPGIATGFWGDILMAMSIIIYGLGVFIVVWKKREPNLDIEVDKGEAQEKENGQN